MKPGNYVHREVVLDSEKSERIKKKRYRCYFLNVCKKKFK